MQFFHPTYTPPNPKKAVEKMIKLKIFNEKPSTLLSVACENCSINLVTSLLLFFAFSTSFVIIL